MAVEADVQVVFQSINGVPGQPLQQHIVKTLHQATLQRYKHEREKKNQLCSMLNTELYKSFVALFFTTAFFFLLTLDSNGSKFDLLVSAKEKPTLKNSEDVKKSCMRGSNRSLLISEGGEKRSLLYLTYNSMHYSSLHKGQNDRACSDENMTVILFKWTTRSERKPVLCKCTFDRHKERKLSCEEKDGHRKQ